MLFSCLVDADFLDTERYMRPEEFAHRKGKKSLQELKPMLDDYLSRLKAGATPSPLNEIRNEIQNLCLKNSASSPGFYSLTVPTGGGKTLSSLVWAMSHTLWQEAYYHRHTLYEHHCSDSPSFERHLWQ